MKYKVVILFALLLLGQVATVQGFENFGSAGGRFDSEEGFIFNGGYGRHIGGPFWAITHLDVGIDKDIGAKIGVFTNLQFIDSSLSQLSIGLIGGPGVNWLADYENGKDISYEDYFRGAGGIAVSYDLTSRLGIGGLAEYKFSIDEDKSVDGWVGWINLFVRF